MNQNPNNKKPGLEKDELEFKIEDLSIDDAKVDVKINSSFQTDAAITENEDENTQDNNDESLVESDDQDQTDQNEIEDIQDNADEIDNEEENLDELDDQDQTDQNESEGIKDNSDENVNDDKNSDESGDQNQTDQNESEGIKDNSDENVNDDKNLDESGDQDQTNQDENKDEDTQNNADKKDNTNQNLDESKTDETQNDKKDGSNSDKPHKADDKNEQLNNPNSSSGNNDAKKNNQSDNNAQPKTGLDKKRDDLKNKWDNRPKNAKDMKDRIKNGAKNHAKNMVNNAKEGAKNGFKNSDLGQSIDKAKNAVDKGKKVANGAKKAGKTVAKAGKVAAKGAAKAAQGLIKLFISALPWSAIILLIVIIIGGLILLFATFSPGIGGDVKEDDNLEKNYSKVDQKTLKKLQDLADKYPNADPTLAMATVLYPYFDTLWDGNVDSLISLDNNNNDAEEEPSDEVGDEDIGDDIEKEESDEEDDDIYLEPFRRRSVRKKFKKALKLIDGKTNSTSSSGTTYLTPINSFSGTKYDNLSDKDITYIAKLCQREQGSAEGAAAEASLIANRYELFGKKFGNIADYVKDSGWWNTGVSFATPSASVMEAVKDVLLNGNRTLPPYVDEHDCISCGFNSYDIKKIVTNGEVITNKSELKNHNNYVQDQTVIYNRYGSIYTFYTFPTKTSDPFGYTSSSYNKANRGNTEPNYNIVNKQTTTSNDEDDSLEYTDALYDALNEYFNWDGGYWTYSGESFNGYKKMFKSVDKDDYEELARAIVRDLMEKKNWFVDYFYDNKTCSSTYESAGTVEVDQLLKGNVLIDVKVSSCKNDIDSCESMYSEPIPFEKYVKGVAYEEIGVNANSDIEKVKAQMLAIKSYTLGRRTATVDSNGNYVIKMRANTNDQDYCDIDIGCSSGATIVSESSAKREPVNEQTRSKLDEAWNVISSVYIYDDKNQKTAGAYCQDRSGSCSFCSKGTCLSHTELNSFKSTDYMSIIADQYSSYKVINIQDNVANLMVSSPLSCEGVNNDGSCGIPDNSFVYYDQKDYTDAFCGRTDGSSIKTSGCGVTSMAMVIANLTDEKNITPVDTMNEAYSGNYCGTGIIGTNSAYFSAAAKKHGLTYEQLSVDKAGLQKAETILRSGGLIIANVNSASPFTNSGHYIVIRKINSEGKVYVGDPNHREFYNTTYSLSSFINGWISPGHAWFAFTSGKSKEIVEKYCSTSVDNTNGQFASNNRKSGVHSGQCIEYVEQRAIDIIKSAKVGYDGIINRYKYTKIWSERNFGGAKCALQYATICTDRTKPSRMKKLFKTSNDYTKPQAGAVIVWDGDERSPYGHVAIIEKVNDDGTVLVGQSNWCKRNCEKFSTNVLTLNQIKKYGTHDFIGYIYLLQPIK